MDVIADIVIPVVTFLLMVVVGHGMTLSELRRSATDVRAVVTGTIGQLVFLPAIATVIVLVVDPGPTSVAGLILVAACPGGTISNFYCHLGRANTALSIMLTAVSCLLSFVTLPALVAAGYFFWLDDVPAIESPRGLLTIQLLGLVALPICLGMVLRRWRSKTAARRESALRQASLVVLVALVVWLVRTQWGAIVASLVELLVVAVVFTALAMAAGACLAWVIGRPAADRLTFLVEFSCRNLALATVVAVTILGRSDLVAFATVLLLVQAVVILTIIGFSRGHRTAG
jgi:BASS family bile acid:Na+ symporter